MVKEIEEEVRLTINYEKNVEEYKQNIQNKKQNSSISLAVSFDIVLSNYS